MCETRFSLQRRSPANREAAADMTGRQKEPIGISIYYFTYIRFMSANSVGTYFYVAPNRHNLKASQMRLCLLRCANICSETINWLARWNNRRAFCSAFGPRQRHALGGLLLHADWLQSFVISAARLASVAGVLKILPLHLFIKRRPKVSGENGCVLGAMPQKKRRCQKKLLLMKWFKVFFLF